LSRSQVTFMIQSVGEKTGDVLVLISQVSGVGSRR
jgi:hypothetical protein